MENISRELIFCLIINGKGIVLKFLIEHRTNFYILIINIFVSEQTLVNSMFETLNNRRFLPHAKCICIWSNGTRFTSDPVCCKHAEKGHFNLDISTVRSSPCDTNSILDC